MCGVPPRANVCMHGGYSGIPCGSIIHILCIRWWSGHNGSGGGTVEPVGADASSVQFPGVRRWEGFGAEVGNTRSSTILYRIIIKGREARDCTIARPCGACLVFSPPSSFHRGGLGCSWWTGSIRCNIQQCIMHGEALGRTRNASKRVRRVQTVSLQAWLLCTLTASGRIRRRSPSSSSTMNDRAALRHR